MSRHSRFIAAILCVLFALTSLCTFAVFAEDIGGGGGADGGDPNGYSDQGGNDGGETPGGGSGDDSSKENGPDNILGIELPGNLEEGELEIGQVASMLNEEKSVEEIFESFRQGFAKAKERLQQM